MPEGIEDAKLCSKANREWRERHGMKEAQPIEERLAWHMFAVGRKQGKKDARRRALEDACKYVCVACAAGQVPVHETRPYAMAGDDVIVDGWWHDTGLGACSPIRDRIEREGEP